MPAEVLKLRDEAVDWRHVEDEIVVLDRASSKYLAVTGSGVTVWPLLVEGSDRGALVAAIRERFDVDADTAARDLDDFLATLRENGLLVEPAG
jgi:hypothetical protein